MVRSKYNPRKSENDKSAPRKGRNPQQNTRHKSGRKSSSSQKPADNLYIYGLHSVRAALNNENRKKIKLFATANGFERIKADIPESLEVDIAEAGQLDALTGTGAVHQGVVLACHPLETLDASELFHLADASVVLALDQITDPHNVGAILRSATAFGVDAVLMTHRQSAAETGTLAKSASGALDLIPIINIRNLSKAIDELNDMGFASVGLDSEGDDVLETAVVTQQSKPILLVLGSEGRGLRQQTREACTTLARLDMPGAIKSLNVSNAAALALYVACKAKSHSSA